METELKLSFPDPETLYAVSDEPWFRKTVEIRSEKTEEYENRYLDTKDRILDKSRTSMRIRHVLGQEYIHTVKTTPAMPISDLSAEGFSGLTSKCEWNVSTDRPEFDVDFFLREAKDSKDPYEILAAALVPVSGKELETVCKTAFKRHTITAEFLGSTVEICLDTGSCIASERSCPICEMEIELISGDVAPVEELGLLIREHADCKPLAVSKYARCLMLMRENENG
ncbi:MAG: CYTH domain-containing protein [Clostridiales bacterium]|nr:CYTH domain-containing protein [Clostridiales bacterium]